MTNANESASPIFLQNGLTHDCHIDTGLTKSEYFAAIAMQGGLLSNHEFVKTVKIPDDWYEFKDKACSASTEFADELIKALNK